MNQKRNTLKKVAGASAILALTPNSWTKPIVSSVVLPAHAQMSTVPSIEVAALIPQEGFNVSTGDPWDFSLVTPPPSTGSDFDVNDNAGGSRILFAELGGNNIDTSAIFSLSVTGLVLNSGTGFSLEGRKIQFQGDVGTDQVVSITASVTNPDGASDSVNFTVGVENNF